MRDRDYWPEAVRKAEQELAAATRPGDVNAAAKRLTRAKANLKWLQQQAPIRQACGVAVTAAIS